MAMVMATMIVTAEQWREPLDVPGLREELEDIQNRLDSLAARGTNPYEIARLQRVLDDARDELSELESDCVTPARV